MLQYLNQKRGQTTLEYAVLIVIIIGALTELEVYMKRDIQGGLKKHADEVGSQYSDGNTNSIKTVSTQSNTEDSFNAGVSSTTMLAPEIRNSTENSVIINTEQEYWGTASNNT